MMTSLHQNRTVLTREQFVQARKRIACKIVFFASLLVALITVLVLLGWLLGVDALKSVNPDWVSMKSNTAIGLLLSAMALAFSTCAKGRLAGLARHIAELLALFVIGFALLTLGQYLFDIDLGIDQILFRDTFNLLKTSHPGRLVPATALCFVLLGFAVLAFSRPAINRLRLPLVKALGVALAFIGGIALLGYAGDLALFSRWCLYIGMAVQTAFCFVALGGALIVAAWGEEGFEWSIDAPTTWGFVVGIALMLLAAQTAYTQAEQLMHTAAVVSHRQDVLMAIGRLSSKASALESLAREDFVTAAERREAQNAVRVLLREVRRLTADSARQNHSLNALEALFEVSFQQGEQAGEALGHNGFPPVPGTPGANDETQRQDRWQRLIQMMEDEEYSLLAGDKKRAETAATTAFLFLPIEALLSFAVLLSGFIFLNSGQGERTRAENQLRASLQEEKDLRNCIDQHSIVAVTNPKGKILSVNDKFCAISGYSREEALGRTPGILNSGHHPKEFFTEMWSTIAAGRVWKGELKNRARDGSLFWVDGTIVPFLGEDGKPLKYVAVHTDITERKIAQEKAGVLLERLQLAARANEAGIWELDLINNESTWDDQMYAIFGLPVESGKYGVERWFRLMHPDDIPRCKSIIAEVNQNVRDSFTIDFRIRRKNDGASRIIRSTGIIKRDSNGRAVGMLGTNRDVTEEWQREEDLANALALEKELSEKAREGEKSKGEFLAVMSHELRNPMNGILGFAEQLAQSPSLPADCRSSAQTILKSSEALLRILDDILDFSRLDAGRMTVEKISFCPRQMMEDIHHLLVRQADGKHLQFETAVDERTPGFLEGDAGRIRQILINLLGNAIKFTDHGSVGLHLRPGAVREDGASTFEFLVRDTGEGISPDKLQSVFQPFTQADSSISRRHGGTGLGLSISHRLTELMGGTLTARSQPGKGSEFLVVIPLGISSQASGTQPDVPPAVIDDGFSKRHPLNILIVEDDSVNLRLIQSLVRKMGYQPCVAHNGSEAVAIYRETSPGCVLMDLQMPEMGGIEATEKIRAWERSSGQRAPAFISALTANIFPADRQRCQEVGMNGYLNKPIKISALAEMLVKAETFRRQDAKG